MGLLIAALIMRSTRGQALTPAPGVELAIWAQLAFFWVTHGFYICASTACSTARRSSGGRTRRIIR